MRDLEREHGERDPGDDDGAGQDEERDHVLALEMIEARVMSPGLVHRNGRSRHAPRRERLLADGFIPAGAVFRRASSRPRSLGNSILSTPVLPASAPASALATALADLAPHDRQG